MPPCKPILKPGTKICLVGEAPGEQEELLGQPFIGACGQELTRILRDAGLSRDDCSITNVFLTRPPGNKIEAFCGKKAEVGGKDYTLPPLRAGKYIRPEYLPELDRLKEELLYLKPNLCVALGATASWALLQQSKITSVRGTITESVLVPGLKVLPTFHPAAVLRQWTLRVIVLSDFMKAREELKFPEIRREKRIIWIEPDLEAVAEFKTKFLDSASRIAIDIETIRDQISCIGFAPSPNLALVVPFIDKARKEWSYWPNTKEEQTAWSLVKAICENSSEKILQNGLYDVQYLWRTAGIVVRNFAQDTMLLHHALQPELPKGLGFLGSIYCNESAWKDLRKTHTTKREE